MLAASTEQTSLCGLLYCLAFHPATQLADWPRVASRPLFAHLQNFCCSGRLLEYNTILFLLVRLLTHGINRGITSLLAGLCFKMQHVMPPLPPCRLFLISPSFSLLSLSPPPPAFLMCSISIRLPEAEVAGLLYYCFIRQKSSLG